MAHVSTIITRLRRGLAKNYKCPKGWRLSQVFLIYFILQLLKQHSESNQRRPKKKEKSQQVRMGPLHPADSQSHAGYTNFKAAWRHLQNSIFTNSVIFFFFSRKTFSASCQHSYNSSIKPSPRWNSPPGQPDALRLQPAGAPLHAIVLHQVKSLQQSSIEEPTDTSSPAIGCTPCKTHSKHFLMDHRPRQDRVYPCFAPYSHDVAQSPAFGTIPSLGWIKQNRK